MTIPLPARCVTRLPRTWHRWIGYLFSASPTLDTICGSESIPLGRVLIDHNVLREVQLSSLWKLQPGEELRRILNTSEGQLIYGRTALIYCNGEPAVELLEIVTPA